MVSSRSLASLAANLKGLGVLYKDLGLLETGSEQVLWLMSDTAEHL